MSTKFYCFLLALLIGGNLSAQEFTLDRGHTFISFSVNRFAAVDVQGRFNEFTGTLSYDSTLQTISAVEVTIDVNSIDTGHETRDSHLKGNFWLDAANYPNIHFESQQITATAHGFLATGTLNIHGVSQEIELPFLMSGPAVDPTQTTAIGVQASILINRQDYGISFSRLMDNGKLFIGNEVTININALAQLVEAESEDE